MCLSITSVTNHHVFCCYACSDSHSDVSRGMILRHVTTPTKQAWRLAPRSQQQRWWRHWREGRASHLSLQTMSSRWVFLWCSSALGACCRTRRESLLCRSWDAPIVTSCPLLQKHVHTGNVGLHVKEHCECDYNDEGKTSDVPLGCVHVWKCVLRISRAWGVKDVRRLRFFNGSLPTKSDKFCTPFL